eukprot:GHVP01021082.1.p1 GENE.GHVP01021082.1~~GHVP01021082.1.p1  ORF type:complete len:257 (+),score=36.26 GHVP01021082.1:170-940(+)
MELKLLSDQLNSAFEDVITPQGNVYTLQDELMPSEPAFHTIFKVEKSEKSTVYNKIIGKNDEDLDDRMCEFTVAFISKCEDNWNEDPDSDSDEDSVSVAEYGFYGLFKHFGDESNHAYTKFDFYGEKITEDLWNLKACSCRIKGNKTETDLPSDCPCKWYSIDRLSNKLDTIERIFSLSVRESSSASDSSGMEKGDNGQAGQSSSKTISPPDSKKCCCKVFGNGSEWLRLHSYVTTEDDYFGKESRANGHPPPKPK